MLTRTPRQFLSLPVADKAGTNGLIKQTAVVRRIVLEWDPDTAELSVVQTNRLLLQANDNGQPGVHLATVQVPDVLLHGDNNSAVDPTTGEVWLNRDNVGLPTEEPLAAWLARVEADPRQMELQGDWLEKLLHKPGTSIADISLGQLAAANQPPYNKFSQ
ncbi:hypothetical protein JAO73_10530 [Hymenobacter sp. BT523]|uniref:hypothetical protein n=1 Tax=Hymenobacter sp. BT523 TaxID=2795725 RepID=UPI0018EB5893|nr:hypothetical protein [Hymenobacter sp. BT523]MBJ6109451.1 hypothetical protein [Hymenobacter sp. BT523]